MNQLLTIITALHVLAHGVFGCCSHHSHHTGGQAGGVAVADCCSAAREKCAEHEDLGHCHHHTASINDASEATQGDENITLCALESSPQQHHQCPHASCQWVAPETGAALALIALDHSSTFCTSVPLINTFATTIERSVEEVHLQHFALPLRLHLALGVLLV